MKQHIGPIYLILGLMAVSTLTIGAGEPNVGTGGHRASTQALMPSPMSFQREVNKDVESERILVISSDQLEADVQAKVARAIATTRPQKAG
jgi:hypothetical protein